ncbi:fasciclin-like arabinogalactan protein 14 [Telopea speciosissima]|uniref:fasciclin-like arabinogalactan protein 14 n=1 Tax=Telopea speciosissima TaxID=54955 RepID=UPI001CC4C71D|nr:fasciclin-like arabinogalactan protein 14 [Telopea speciosissima]
MNPRISSSFICCLSFFLLFFTSATAFNITKILGANSDFSNLNDLLTQTQLASQINSRQTITLLALDNGAIGSLSGKSNDEVKNILELHVVLDYYDQKKLEKISNKTALLTTLFQTSGLANSQLGFLNVTVTSDGIAFGSAVKGSPIDSKLVKSVASQPYNISVLQISAPILPQGIDGVKANSSSNHTVSSPPPSDSPAGAPKKSPTKAPTGSPSKAPSPKSAKAPAPSDAPVSDAPASDAPKASDTPTSSPPSPAEADAPAGDSSADAPGPSKDSSSSATRVSVGMFISAVTLGMASWFAF